MTIHPRHRLHLLISLPPTILELATISSSPQMELHFPGIMKIIHHLDTRELIVEAMMGYTVETQIQKVTEDMAAMTGQETS